jgi:hypothetical protein
MKINNMKNQKLYYELVLLIENKSKDSERLASYQTQILYRFIQEITACKLSDLPAIEDIVAWVVFDKLEGWGSLTKEDINGKILDLTLYSLEKI